MKLELNEDEIGRKLEQARLNGELLAAESYGKPLREDSGWDQTPEEFRMPFKILKDAGVVPPEVELFRQRGRLQKELACAGSDADRRKLGAALSELEQKIALRLEALRANRSL